VALEHGACGHQRPVVGHRRGRHEQAQEQEPGGSQGQGGTARARELGQGHSGSSLVDAASVGAMTPVLAGKLHARPRW